MALPDCVRVIFLLGCFWQYSESYVLRRQKRAIPIQLPANYRPYGDQSLTSNSPFGNLLPINPFTHNFGFSTDYQGANPQFNGDLHFPVVDNQNKVYYPFDLDGKFKGGTTNVQLAFGETANAVNPLDIPVDRLYPCLLGMCGGQ